MRIDVEYVKHLKAELRKINAVELKEIEWYENGIKCEISAKALEDWRFTGLNTSDFIDTDFYKGDGFEEWELV